MRKTLSYNDKIKQTEFWPILKIDSKSIGLDILLKLKKEIKIEQQKQN
jgi:hypothetical protein|tara:strand:+ start:1993 stop:2136 length:144 start_codon:yes stop_codon:yes gene_type:complete